MAFLKSQDDVKERKKTLLNILDKKKMNVSSACKAAGISRFTFYNYLQKDQEFRDKVKALDEKKIDYVEDKLVELINDKVPSAIFFFLKCKAKHRGYIERQEVSVGGEIKHIHQLSEGINKLDDISLNRLLKAVEGECTEIKEKEIKTIESKGE